MKLSVIEWGTFKAGLVLGLIAGLVVGFVVGWFMFYGLIRFLTA